MRKLVIGAVATVLLTGAAPAYSASLGLSAGSDHGFGVALEDQPVTIGASVFTSDAEGERDLTVKIRPASQGACAAAPGADPGKVLISERVSGSPRPEAQHTEPEPVQLRACGWLTVPGTGEVSAQDELDVPVEQPALSLRLLLATPPLRGVPVVVRAEADGPPGRLYLGGAGPDSAGPCPAAAGASAFEPFFPAGAAIFPSGGLEADAVFGPVPPGGYRACGWLQEQVSDPQAERTESLEFAIPARRTATTTSLVAELFRGRRRTELWIVSRVARVRFPVREGRILLEYARNEGRSNRALNRFHRTGAPVNLAGASRFDICVRGEDHRDAVRAIVRHPPNVRLRGRYLGSADFKRSRGETFGGAGNRRDLRGYDRERDRCLRGGPVPAPGG